MSERSLRFPADVAQVASVRDFAIRAADDLASAVDRDDLAVIVGELAANAAEHQPDEAELVVRSDPDGSLVVAVVDSDATIPVAHHAEPTDPDGHRGLFLVSVLSESWGVEPDGHGKRVWARLAPRP